MTTTKRRPDLDSLYCINEDGSRNTIHTADVRGRFQDRKRWLWVGLIAVYLALPWITINGNPAILIDIAHRSFFVFGQTFNAQDVWLFFFVITGVGFTLYVVSALFGRVWCGYGCPHTVFLDGVYRRVERWFDGDAVKRKRLAAAPWSADKVVRRGGKWVVYLGLSFLLAHTFLSYFMPARVVWAAVTGPPSAHPFAFGFVVFFTAITYANFAWFREQLCIVICPYGRLQGVLYDADTIQVGYDASRGEPRGKYTESGIGDCIDCQRCVAVCPTGIDIRNGTQLECVGCANCIDACDEVMDRVERPRGLIRYDSQQGLEGRPRRFFRPRLYAYVGLLLLGVVVASLGFASREALEAKLVRSGTGAWEWIDNDRSAVRNTFRLHLINKSPSQASFSLAASGELAARADVIVPFPRVTLDSLESRYVPVVVTVTRPDYRPGERIEIEITTGAGLERTVEAPFLGPGK